MPPPPAGTCLWPSPWRRSCWTRVRRAGHAPRILDPGALVTTLQNSPKTGTLKPTRPTTCAPGRWPVAPSDARRRPTDARRIRRLVSSAIIDSCESSRSWTRGHRARLPAADRHRPSPTECSTAPPERCAERRATRGGDHARPGRAASFAIRRPASSPQRRDRPEARWWSSYGFAGYRIHGRHRTVATSAMPAGPLSRQGRGARPQDGNMKGPVAT